MNDTVTLPRLAELVAAHASCQYVDAEKFVKAFFAHLEDALAVSDEVIIDGLGTFSRTSDPDNPIAFHPAKSIADALNQPFEMFEPIAVGDTDLTTIDEIPSPQKVSEPPVTPPTPPSAESTETHDEVNEDKEYIAPTPPPTPTPMPAPPQNPVSEPVETPTYYAAARPRIAPWVILAFILGLVIGATIVYCSYEKIDTMLRPDIYNNEQINETSIIEPLPKNDIQIIEDIEDDSISTPIDTVITSEQSTNPKPSPVYDTVTPERFLTTMARQYYGQMEYWVFIYEANAEILGNPNRIKPGTRVIIPSKTQFTEGETPEQTLARAKQKGREIYDRFR